MLQGLQARDSTARCAGMLYDYDKIRKSGRNWRRSTAVRITFPYGASKALLPSQFATTPEGWGGDGIGVVPVGKTPTLQAASQVKIGLGQLWIKYDDSIPGIPQDRAYPAYGGEAPAPGDIRIDLLLHLKCCLFLAAQCGGGRAKGRDFRSRNSPHLQNLPEYDPQSKLNKVKGTYDDALQPLLLIPMATRC
jgi:hypothetical protein